MTVFLTVEDLLVLAEEIGGLRVRDIGLLDAAAHRPAAAAFGEDAYPDLHTKAAALMESVARNHALTDGNKRLSWVAVVVFYRLNGFRLAAPEDAAYDLVVRTARGEVRVGEAAQLLASWVHG